jgi:hypothetical protein
LAGLSSIGVGNDSPLVLREDVEPVSERQKYGEWFELTEADIAAATRRRVT